MGEEKEGAAGGKGAGSSSKKGGKRGRKAQQQQLEVTSPLVPTGVAPLVMHLFRQRRIMHAHAGQPCG